jgi:hypothetical protein
LAILPLYADRPGRELTTLDELRNAIAANPEILVVFHEAHWRDVQAECAPPASVYPFAMGKKRLVLVRFVRQD